MKHPVNSGFIVVPSPGLRRPLPGGEDILLHSPDGEMHFHIAYSLVGEGILSVPSPLAGEG